MKAFTHFVVEKSAKVTLSSDGKGDLRIEVHTRHPIHGEHVVIEIRDVDEIILK